MAENQEQFISCAPFNFINATFCAVLVRKSFVTVRRNLLQRQSICRDFSMIESVESFLARLKKRDPDQPEFHQAVEEVLRSLWPFLEANPHYLTSGILERICEPERAVVFRVSWVDDQGTVQVNRGFRIQMNSAIGPY